MKTTYLITAAIGAALLTTTSAIAGPWDAKPATAGVQGDRSTYVGTSLPDPRKRIYLENPNAAFPDPDNNGAGYVVGTAGPEKGKGEEYGSVLFDVGVLP